MASIRGTDMSRDQFLCSICLDVFSQPVTIACGHNFCKACLTDYWDGSLVCHCPLCNTLYAPRPKLSVNTLISELAASFPAERATVGANSHQVGPGEVPCDICPVAKCKAVKSCLGCLASFCKTHLEPHGRVDTYKKHQLIDPVANLEDRLCKKHDKVLEIFCRSDQKCICVMCLNSEHKAHDTTSLKEECDQRQAELRKLWYKAQLMKSNQAIKMQELRRFLLQNNSMAVREKEEANKVFSDLVAAVQRSQAMHLEEIEERRRSVEKQALGFIKQLEKDIAGLQRKIAELELSSHAEDHHQFLETLESLSSFPVIVLDKVCVRGFQSLKHVWMEIAQLEEKLFDAVPKAKLKMVQERYAVEVTLDPATAKAGAGLILSEDGKQLRATRMSSNVDDRAVLGKQGFRSCSFYYEVQVPGNTEWQLGVIDESFKHDRNSRVYWSLQRDKMGRYSCPHQLDYRGSTQTSNLSLSTNPKRIGVFVDRKGGQVCFYDDNGNLLHSFTGCKFQHKLYPVLWSCDTTPLVIMPVKRKDCIPSVSMA